MESHITQKMNIFKNTKLIECPFICIILQRHYWYFGILIFNRFLKKPIVNAKLH